MKNALERPARLLMLAALLAACDSGSPTGDGNGPPTLSLAVTSTTLSLEQQGTASIPVTITRGGTFTGAVTVDVTGLPSGVTAAPATISSNATSGTVVLTASAGATPGASSLTVTAGGSGVTAATATVALTTNVHGTYTMAAAPAALSIAAGGTGHSDIAITRLGGFAGTVAVTATAPAGITATLAPASLTVSAPTAGLDVAVAATVAPGIYTVAVQGATAGLANQSASVAVTVTPASTFSIAAPASLSVTQGLSVVGTVNITRGGPFAGAVALTATSPAGLTVTFNPASATGATSGVTISAASTVAPGTYNVIVLGNATGLSQQSSTIAVTVTAPIVPAITVAVAPSPINVIAGSSASATLSVTRTGGFTGAVNVTADAAPTGVTVSLNPASIGTAASTSALTVTAASTVAAGTFNITLRSTGTGIAETVVTVPVTVTASAGSFTLAVTPTSLSVAPGSQGTATVNVTRVAPFTGAVALTATAPAGITVTFAPTSIATATTSSVATVAVASNVAPGTYSIAVKGTSAGVSDANATLQLTVPAPGGFAVTTVSPITMSAGATASANLTITRTGSFTDAVTFTANSPAGTTVLIAPSSTTGSSVSFNVSSTTFTPIGTSTITIHANAPGQPEQLINVSLTITSAVNGSGVVTWKFCDASGIPLWVAGQSSFNGTWQQLAGSNNTYSFDVSGTGGIAYVTARASGGFQTNVVYGSVSELQDRGTGLCGGTSGAGKTVTVSATGLLATDLAAINLGNAASQTTATPFTYSLPNLFPGPRDLIAGQIHVVTDPATQTTSLTPGKFVLIRDLDVPNGTSAGTIDFANGLTPVSATITLNNLLGHQAGITSLLVTSTSAGFYMTELATTSATHTWYGFPASSLRSTDLYELIVTAGAQGDNSASRGIIAGLNSVRNETYTLGPVLTAPVATVTSRSPYVRIKQDYVIQPTYDKYFDGRFSQGNSTTTRTFSIHTSVAVTGTTIATLEIPDLSGVTGWSNTWGLQTGVSTNFGFTATGYTGAPPAASFTTQGVFDGLIYYSGTKNLANITP